MSEGLLESERLSLPLTNYMVLGKLTLTILNSVFSSVKWEKHLLHSIFMEMNEIMHLNFWGQCISHGKNSVSRFTDK